MTYKKKYLHYKNKVLNFKSDNGDKYGIFMLCMLKDHYVLGACIGAYNHRHYLKSINKQVELVIMCDSYIYDKYKNTLKFYFDRVIKIKLKTYKLNEEYLSMCGYNFNKKYNWLQYSLSKWICIKYEEYKKILFLDVDILVNNSKFYKLFDYNTPAFHNVRYKKKCVNNNSYNYDLGNDFKYYIKHNFNKYGSIDGGICLIKPDKNTYTEYYKFIDKTFKKGLYSKKDSGPDETSLFYFYSKNNKQLYDICKDYAVIPWEFFKFNKVAKAYNFLSFVKPWIKPKFLSWKEESVWIDLFNSMPHKGEIKLIYRDLILSNYNNYILLDNYKQKKYYNSKIVKTYPYFIKQIEKSDNKFEEIMKIDKLIKFKNYGFLNRKMNSFDNIHKIKNQHIHLEKE